MNTTIPVTQKNIEDGLISLGLGSGDSLIVHSSLSSFGFVEGGADTVIDSLLAVAGANGRLMMPTFTSTVSRFDPLTEPSQTGAISEAFRKRSGVLRSYHANHSVAVYGQHAGQLIAGHEMMAGLGIGCPLDKLASMGGYVLLLGVDLRACSLIHVAEAYAYVPFLGQLSYEGAFTEADVLIPEHGWLHFRFSTIPGCSLGFNRLKPYLEAEGCIRETLIGQAKITLLPGQDLLSVARALFEEDPSALLCDRAECHFCDAARRILTSGVERL